MSAHTQVNHSHEHAEHHSHGGPAVYLKILIALLCLTFITVFVARHPFEDNTVNVVIALVIASIKASLVALVFMHLKYDRKINAVALVAGFLFLGLMLGACMTDYLTRESVLPGAPVPGGPPAPESHHPGVPSAGGAGGHSTPAAPLTGEHAGQPGHPQ